MRCNYIRAVGATLLQYVSVLPAAPGRDTAIYVFVQCECASKKARGNYGFLRTLEPGNRNMRIRSSPNAPLKKRGSHGFARTLEPGHQR